jgi:hypothetical protein
MRWASIEIWARPPATNNITEGIPRAARQLLSASFARS